MMLRPLLAALIGVAFLATPARAADTRIGHGLSLFGELNYGKDFKHFDYVNPDAPKGGTARLVGIGGFDSLNPYITKGVSATGLGFTYDTLLKESYDEPGSEYGLIAQSVEVPSDSSYVIFTLRPEARWHDGKPVTADDVVFSFQTLKEKGAPFYRFYYANVVKAEALSPSRVRFTFNRAGNRELPLIVGQIPILPKHYWKGRDFAKTTLEPPLTSGPYRIASVDPNRSITYERVADYWAKDLPVNVGQNNFEQVSFIYFGDSDIALEGFFADAYDFRAENSAKNWATRYDVPPVNDKRIVRTTITQKTPEPMQGFVFNLRRTDKFSDIRVREAFDDAFDFEWAKKNLFYDQYVRTASYFPRSELAATGLPTPAEQKLLEPYRNSLPRALFTTPYSPPKTDGTGNDRANLRKADGLLSEAGWVVKGGKRVNDKTGVPLAVEFLLFEPTFERVVQFYKQNLDRLGIASTIRIVDDAQYTNRIRNFDFDIVIGTFPESLSPGNEQREFWGSEAADRPESRNIIGIKNPVVDALIDKIIFAESREALVTATHALDRVLLWNHYLVPQWHIPYERVAYWNRFAHPPALPPYSDGFPAIWWFDQAKAAAIAKAKP
jgi:microcin C transport system substrate-binding protein